MRIAKDSTVREIVNSVQKVELGCTLFWLKLYSQTFLYLNLTQSNGSFPITDFRHSSKITRLPRDPNTSDIPSNNT